MKVSTIRNRPLPVVVLGVLLAAVFFGYLAAFDSTLGALVFGAGVAAFGIVILPTAAIAGIGIVAIMTFAVLVPVQATTDLLSVGPFSGLLILVLMACAATGAAIFKGGIGKILVGGKIALLAGVFFFVYFVATVANASEGLVTSLALLMLWASSFVMALYSTRPMIVVVLAVWVTLGFAEAGYALYEFYATPEVLYSQYLTEGYRDFIALTGGVGGLPRSHASFGHPIPLGTFLATTFALAFWAVRMPFERYVPLLKIAVLGVLAVGTVVTFSRSSLIALFLAILIGLLSRDISTGKKAGILVACLVPVLIASQTPLGQNALDYIAGLRGTVSFEQRAASLQALPVLLDDGVVSTLFGRGTGSVAELFGAGAISQQGSFQVIDNQFVTLFIQLGLLGVGVFLLLIWFALSSVWKMLGNGKMLAEDVRLVRGVGIALATVLAAIFFYDGLSWPSTAILIWTLLGFIAVYDGEYREKPKRDPEKGNPATPKPQKVPA